MQLVIRIVEDPGYNGWCSQKTFKQLPRLFKRGADSLVRLTKRALESETFWCYGFAAILAALLTAFIRCLPKPF